MNTAEITSQQSAAGDGKQRGGFSKSVPRKKSGCIFKLVAPHCLPPLSRSVRACCARPNAELSYRSLPRIYSDVR